jgi:hypothetical protein
MVHEIVNESGLEVRVRHMAYTGRAGPGFRFIPGLEPGTAKDVAKADPVQVDWSVLPICWKLVRRERLRHGNDLLRVGFCAVETRTG